MGSSIVLTKCRSVYLHIAFISVACSECKPSDLPCSASRVAGENGPSVRRAFGHAASPRRCTRHPGLPASRARSSPAAPPDCALVCFAGQNDPAAASVSRVRSGRLPARVGQTYRQHTHMSAEAYPPDGPQISPRQGSQNFSARAAGVGGVGPVFDGAPVVGDAPGKL